MVGFLYAIVYFWVGGAFAYYIRKHDIDDYIRVTNVTGRYERAHDPFWPLLSGIFWPILGPICVGFVWARDGLPRFLKRG